MIAIGHIKDSVLVPSTPVTFQNLRNRIFKAEQGVAESILKSSKSKAALTVSSDQASAIIVSKDLEAIPVPGIIEATTATPANNHELMLDPVFHASETTAATVLNDLDPMLEAVFTQSQASTVEQERP
ncbi:hypothetical protein FQA39_LY10923 [Lamprigera yunnana]|nr:hypothetical protein FQA39_LY10923 [Lamprigera yunnana]